MLEHEPIGEATQQDRDVFAAVIDERASTLTFDPNGFLGTTSR